VIEIEYLDLEDVVEMVRILMVGPIRDVGLLDSAVNRLDQAPLVMTPI